MSSRHQRMTKDTRKMLAEFKDVGFEFSIGRSGHWKVLYEGKIVALLPNSPSDHRSLLNARAELRRFVSTK